MGVALYANNTLHNWIWFVDCLCVLWVGEVSFVNEFEVVKRLCRHWAVVDNVFLGVKRPYTYSSVVDVVL